MSQPTPQPGPRPAPNPPPWPPGPAPHGDESARKWTVAEKALSAIAGGLAVFSAFLALQAAQVSSARDEAQQAEQSTSEDLSSLQRQFDQLRAENQKLGTENQQLRDQAGLPGGPTADPVPTSGVTVRHSGPLTLAYSGNSGDLDSPQSDPQWQSGDRNSEITYEPYNPPSLDISAPAISLGSVEADYNSCRTTTGYKESYFPASDIAVGDYFCIKTSGERYSALKVTGVSDEQLSFDIVTYDPPGN